MHSCEGGDEASLDSLCEIYGPPMRRMLRARLGWVVDRLESSGVFKETLRDVLREGGQPGLESCGALLNWIAHRAEDRIRTRAAAVLEEAAQADLDEAMSRLEEADREAVIC